MDKNKLATLENQVIEILQGRVADIISATRKNMVVIEEKENGDSATVADFEIGNIFDSELPKLLPQSLVIQEESFNENIYKRIAGGQRYLWVVDPIDGTKAFREPQNTEWCVGVCLLEDFEPIFSAVFLPEPWLCGKPLLLSANRGRKELHNFGKVFNEKWQRFKTRHRSGYLIH